MTNLHSGAKFSEKNYRYSGGLHGVGVSVVNALSKNCFVNVKRDGKITTQSYEFGKATSGIETIGNTDESGTQVTFHPDDNIFQETKYHFDTIDERLRELAYLNSGIKITLTDLREDNKNVEHYYEGGLGEFIIHLDEGHRPVFEEPIQISGEREGIPVELALRYMTAIMKPSSHL